MDIILKGDPRSTNNIYKKTNFGIYMSKAGRQLKQSYVEQAIEQWDGAPWECDLEIWIEIYFGTKRKSDWDNFHKLSMDALTGIVWIDDSQIQVAHVSKFYSKEDPRIEITIGKL
jgi:Holliday junction resolvase RusA-like endonuclease